MRLVPSHSAIELDRLRRANRARLGELQRRYRELTRRECEALSLITAGLLNKQVASVMGISPMTVQIHRGRIMRKMAARSFADLVRIADAQNVGGAPTEEQLRPLSSLLTRQECAMDTTLPGNYGHLLPVWAYYSNRQISTEEPDLE